MTSSMLSTLPFTLLALDSVSGILTISRLEADKLLRKYYGRMYVESLSGRKTYTPLLFPFHREDHTIPGTLPRGARVYLKVPMRP